ncbi:MAG: fibronectin type III domain-containing protein [Patescibacteria group bacterium]
MNLIKKVKNRLKRKKLPNNKQGIAAIVGGDPKRFKLPPLRSRRGMLFVMIFAISGAAVLYLIFAAGVTPSDEQDQVSRINKLRTSKGVATLKTSSCLTTAARVWAQQMAANGAISHNPNLASLSEKYCGTVPRSWSRLAENVGLSYTGSATLFDAFVASSGHYKNMVSDQFNIIGVGAYTDGAGALWVVQVYALCNDCWGGAAITPPPDIPPPAPVATGVGSAMTPDRKNWWVVESTGKVRAYGPNAQHYGDMAGKVSNMKGMVASATGRGYWLLAEDGGIFAYGDAPFYGSTGGQSINAKIVGIAAHPSGRGYWLAGADGAVYPFGDPAFVKSWGSMAGKKLNLPIVGISSSASGSGYWLVAGDGGIFAYGDAPFYGSTGDIKLNAPIITMTSTADGKGYWMLAKDGGIFSYGNAVFYGSTGNTGVTTPAIGFVVAADNAGYFIIEGNGTKHPFGSAALKGVVIENNPNAPPPLPTFKTSMTYTDSWPKDYTPTNITASWTTAWPQERIPRDLQMNWYTASDGNGLPGSCVQIHESSEPPEHAWGDNHLCSNQDLGWSYTSAWPPEYPLAPKCVGLYEPGDPDTWGDNVLCTLIDVNLRWSYWGNISDTNTTCVSMNEAEDPHYWTDNFLCWDTYKPGSVSAPLPAGCINMNETSETAPWYDNVLCMSPDLGLTWSTAHPDPTNLPANCVRIYEPDDPDTWGDNVICTSNPNVHFDWSWRGNIYEDADTGCVKIEEPSDWDGGGYGWEDNFLCWNKYLPSIKPLNPGCIYINESADPHGWNDNVLCASPEVGLSFNTNYSADLVVPSKCVRIEEPADPYSWTDNVLCTNTYIALRWSFNGSLDDAETDCVLVNEGYDPHSWGDNYLCWYVPPPASADQPDLIVVPDSITWTPASPQSGNLVTVSATVKNVGTASTPEGLVIAFSVDGASAGWNGSAGWPLAPGESRTLTSVDGPGGVSTWTATAGSHTVLAVVDPSNAFPNELNENNNTLTKSLNIVAPNTPPTVPSSLRATSVTSNSIALAWNAATDDKGVAQYRVYRNGSFYATTTQLTYTDTGSGTGLSPQTPYTYQVSAVDAEGLESARIPASPGLSVTTLAAPDTTPPTAPGTLNATTPSATQVNLSWTASTDNFGVTGYQVSRRLTSSPAGSESVLIPSTQNLSYNDTSLAANTSYTYYVKAKDAANNYSSAASKTIATLVAPDTIKPTAPTNLSATAVSSTQINLSWTASTDTGGSGLKGYKILRDGQVIYTTTTLATGYGDGTPLQGSHTYTVTAYDGAGNNSDPSNPAPSTTPLPAAALTTSQSPQGNWVGTYGKDGYVLFDWNAGHTDLTALPTGVTMTVNGAERYQWNMNMTDTQALQSPDKTIRRATAIYTNTQFDVKLNFSSAYSGNLHLYAVDWDTGLRRQTVTVTDGSGSRNVILSSFNNGVWINAPVTVSAGGSITISVANTSTTTNMNAVLAGLFLGEGTTTTPPPADTTPPAAPTNPRTTTTPTYNKVDLAWDVSTDNVGVTKYQVLRNNTAIGNPTGTTFSDTPTTGLAAGTTYSYTVKAYDAANNASAASNALNVPVPASPDTTPPAPPYDLKTATTPTYNKVDLAWTASTSTDTARYLLYKGNSVIADLPASTTTYTDTFVSHSSTYSYYLKAKDTTGNISTTTSNILSVITPAASTTGGDTTPPTAPINLIPTIINSNQVNLRWTAATDNVRVDHYDIYRNGTKIGSTTPGSTSTTYGDATARPNTAYSYTVKAVDSSGNIGPASAAASISATNKK